MNGLSFPAKEEMIAYLRKTFSRTEEFIEKLDSGMSRAFALEMNSNLVVFLYLK
jgi:hypothetical protein